MTNTQHLLEEAKENIMNMERGIREGKDPSFQEILNTLTKITMGIQHLSEEMNDQIEVAKDILQKAEEEPREELEEHLDTETEMDDDSYEVSDETEGTEHVMEEDL